MPDVGKPLSSVLGFYCSEETLWPLKFLQRKIFNWSWLTVQRLSSLLLWLEAWQHATRYGAGEVSESSISGFAGRREWANRPGLSFCLHPAPMRHLSSNNAIPTPSRSHFLMSIWRSLPMSLWDYFHSDYYSFLRCGPYLSLYMSSRQASYHNTTLKQAKATSGRHRNQEHWVTWEVFLQSMGCAVWCA